MPYPKAKVYYDGSHFIATPPENFPRRKRRYQPKKEEKLDTPKEKFETAYAESQSLPRRERKKYIKEQMKEVFSTEEETTAYVNSNIERKKNNAIKRRIRLWRKVNLQQWNYFVTVTHFYGYFLFYLSRHKAAGCLVMRVMTSSSSKSNSGQ